MNTETVKTMENIIFKNDKMEIFWHTGGINHTEAKGVKIKCKAINPHDGNEYEKIAGWIGVSMTLHGGAKTQGYIYDAACELIGKHKAEILPLIVDFLEKNGNKYRAQEFKDANGRSAGNGVDFKTSHPLGEGQRDKVRRMMQKNAPAGTNHL